MFFMDLMRNQEKSMFAERRLVFEKAGEAEPGLVPLSGDKPMTKEEFIRWRMEADPTTTDFLAGLQYDSLGLGDELTKFQEKNLAIPTDDVDGEDSDDQNDGAAAETPAPAAETSVPAPSESAELTLQMTESTGVEQLQEMWKGVDFSVDLAEIANTYKISKDTWTQWTGLYPPKDAVNSLATVIQPQLVEYTGQIRENKGVLQRFVTGPVFDTDEKVQYEAAYTYAGHILSFVRNQFKMRFEQVDKGKKWQDGGYGNISYALEIRGGKVGELTFISDKIGDAAKLQEFYEADAAKDENILKALQEEANKPDEDAAKRAEDLYNSSFGQFLKAMGGGPLYLKGTQDTVDTKSIYYQAANGECWWLALIAGALGVAGFTEGYDGLMGWLPKEMRDSVDSGVKKLQKQVDDKRMEGGKKIDAPTFLDFAHKNSPQEVNAEFVGKRSSLLGLTLTQDVKLATDKEKQKCVLELGSGEDVMFAKKAEVYEVINGEEKPVEDTKKLIGSDEARIYVVKGVIPRGTFFADGVKVHILGENETSPLQPAVETVADEKLADEVKADDSKDEADKKDDENDGEAIDEVDNTGDADADAEPKTDQ